MVRGRKQIARLRGKQNEKEDNMVFKQYRNHQSGSLSYLIGDPDKGVAVIVDPDPEVAPYRRTRRCARLNK